MNVKKAQSNMELLILLGIIMVVILSIVFFTLRPTEEIDKNRAAASLQTISEYANQVVELGPGNTMRFKVEMPKGVRSIENDVQGISMTYQDEKLYQSMKRPLVGSILGEINTGVYDIIITSFDTYACAYFPDEDITVCDCDKPKLHSLTEFSDGEKIQCEIDGEFKKCDENNVMKFDDTVVTSLRAKCTNLSDDNFKGKVLFSIINRKNEIIYEESVFNYDNDNVYYLENLNYVVNYSGPLTFKASCISECYDYGIINNNDNNDYIVTAESIANIPYGKIIPFVLDIEGNIIYTDDISTVDNFFLVSHPTNEIRHSTGRVKKDDTFIVRTGYKCEGGECVDVSATLWHGIGVDP